MDVRKLTFVRRLPARDRTDTFIIAAADDGKAVVHLNPRAVRAGGALSVAGRVSSQTQARGTTQVVTAIFAGDRRVWHWAAIAGLPLVCLIIGWCIVPRPYYTGTDSVNALTATGAVPTGQQACAAGLNLPARTARVQVAVISGSSRLPALQMVLRAGGQRITSRLPATATASPGLNHVAFPIPPSRTEPASVPASLCLRAGGPVGWGITPTTEGIQPPLTLNGKPQLARLAVWYLPPPGSQRSYLDEATTMFDRAAVFAPGFARPWVFAFVLLVLLPVVALLAVRCLAVAVTGRGARLALWVYVLVALNGASWALITPAFQAPDEVDHFAYVQSLVEQGQKTTPYPASHRLRWSTSEDDALRGSGMITDHQTSDSRAPWLPADVAAYKQLVARTGSNTSDGGGYQGTAGYGPLYYLGVAPGYLIASTSSPFTQLMLVRLFSVLIGGLTALFTFLLVREMFPRRPWLAVLGGFVVGLQPMYGFVSGTVNNDIGIDAGAAACLYLLVRMVRRGVRWKTTLPLGLLLGALPFLKGSGLDLYPLAALALGGALWMHRAQVRIDRRATAIAVGVLAVSWVVVYGAAALLQKALTPAAPYRGAAQVVATAGGSLTVILHHPTSYLSYLWEMLLPRLPFMAQHFPPNGLPANTIFVRRGWAAFGWYDTFFPEWVYRLLLAVMLVTAIAGLFVAWRRRDMLRRHPVEVALLLLCPLVVVAGFAAVFYTPGQRTVIAEHGRYAFPALAALTVWVIVALHAVGPRRMIASGAMLLVAVLALSYASQLLVFVSFYS